MTTTDNTNDWTPLPAKWTPSSVLKLHDQLLSKFMKEMLQQNKKLTREEKNKRIANFVQWIQLIHNYTMSGQMTYKKDADRKS